MFKIKMPLSFTANVYSVNYSSVACSESNTRNHSETTDQWWINEYRIVE